MEAEVIQSVNPQDAFIWSIVGVAPIVLTIVIHVMMFRKMAYFKERSGLKWLATIGVFIVLSILKPFVTQALLQGQGM